MKAPGFVLALSLVLSIASTLNIRGADLAGAPFTWLILSPIPVVANGRNELADDANHAKAFAADLLAEAGGEARIMPRLGGKVSAQGVEREWKAAIPGFRVNLRDEAENEEDNQIAYAATEFEVSSATDAWLGVGSDDGVKVWLNGELVHEKWVRRGVAADDDVVSIKLRSGKNRLLLKIQNRSGGWGFACRLMNAEQQAARLITAAREGNLSTLRELIKRGFDLNGRTPDGLTPYLAAQRWGQQAVAEFLAQNGADVHVPAPPLANLVNAVFQEWNVTNGPGCGVAIIEKGKVVFEQGYGIANLEYEAPIKPDTVFHVASVSKQFTAMAVVLLEADGKLGLEDDVHKFLPELPDYGAKITIRHLLQHTSGLRDQWQTMALAGWNMQDVITQDQILRMMFRQKELNFPPGTRHLYCNGGYTLLAEIVSRVAGKPFPLFCAERIFTPLGMAHTHFHQDLTQLVPGRAYSYEKTRHGYAAAPLNYANVGATSLFTTAGDLVKWLDNFRVAKVGGVAGIARLQEGAVLADGTKIPYGLGITLGDFRGVRTISHGGADAGYRSEVLWFPEQEWGVAILSNSAEFNPWAVARTVASVCLQEKLSNPSPKNAEPERRFLTLEPAELEKYAGFYRLPAINQSFQTAVRAGKLYVVSLDHAPFELRATGPARFYLTEFQADIEFSGKGESGMVVKVIETESVTEGERTNSPGPVEADLSVYVGTYWSEELETQYTIAVREGKLFAQHAHHGEFALVPTFRDEFSTRQWFSSDVKFLRDGAGQIVGLTLGGGRVKAIQFTRSRSKL
jgi:CubicO group peptidase (beta-lactamase class C family)